MTDAQESLGAAIANAHASLRKRSIALILCTLVGLVMASVSTDVRAQTPPSEAELRAIVQEQLPPFWRIDRLEATEAVNYGNAVEPEWRRRLTIHASPTADLFVPVERQGMPGHVTVLSRAIAKGERREEYGVASSRFAAGKWSTSIRPDGSQEKFIAGQARPMANYSGKVVLVGSADERAALEEASQQVLSAAKAAHEAKLQELRDSFNSQTAKLLEEQKAALEALAQKFRQSEEMTKAARALSEQRRQQTEAEGEAVKRMEQLLQQRSDARTRIFAYLDNKNEARSTRAIQAALATDFDWLKSGVLERGMALQGAPRLVAVRASLTSSYPALKREAFRKVVEGRWTGEVTCRDAYTNTYAFDMRIVGSDAGAFTGQVAVSRLDRRTSPTWTAEIADVRSNADATVVHVAVGHRNRTDYEFLVDKESLGLGNPTLFRHVNQWFGSNKRGGRQGSCSGDLQRSAT